MARRQRRWDDLSPSTQRRYIARGRSMGQSASEVRAYYTAGGNMSVYRGHGPKLGATESQWRRMRRIALETWDPQIDGDLNDVLESSLRKGFTPEWIIARLREKKQSRDEYRDPTNRRRRAEGAKMAGRQPGNRRYFARNLTADIELYYYH